MCAIKTQFSVQVLGVDYVCVCLAVGGEKAFTALEKKQFLSLVMVIYLVVVRLQLLVWSAQSSQRLENWYPLLCCSALSIQIWA